MRIDQWPWTIELGPLHLWKGTKTWPQGQLQLQQVKIQLQLLEVATNITVGRHWTSFCCYTDHSWWYRVPVGHLNLDRWHKRCTARCASIGPPGKARLRLWAAFEAPGFWGMITPFFFWKWLKQECQWEIHHAFLGFQQTLTNETKKERTHFGHSSLSSA